MIFRLLIEEQRINGCDSSYGICDVKGTNCLSRAVHIYVLANQNQNFIYLTNIFINAIFKHDYWIKCGSGDPC